MRRETILRILLVLLILVLAAFIFYNMTSPLAIYPEEAKTKLKEYYIQFPHLDPDNT